MDNRETAPLDTFEDLFRHLSGHVPHDWQRDDLAADTTCGNRLIRIPTGFGKTLGVLAAWIFHRLVRQDAAWPRRLVWCLPMRVLVEQTEQEARAALDRLGLLWQDAGARTGKVGVYTLMGGTNSGDWYLYPEECAILVGTQDMLLSRALNRGYASPRARWPMEFGLLNHDCLWVMDEVQLMDVGLATSAQLQAFRLDDESGDKSFRPTRTWWMSATLQPAWLDLGPDTRALTQDLPTIRIPPEGRTGSLWEEVSKPVTIEAFKDANSLAKRTAERHLALGRGAGGPTLVVVNTVERATEVAQALRDDKRLAGTDVPLIHSRFRPYERAAWRQAFLNRSACGAGVDRIIVATQVIEAGVDLSGALLITELAPWASLVQRFGRCARWGGRAEVLIADFGHKGDKAAAPYRITELDAAREALGLLPDGVAPVHLEAFEEQHAELLPRLYPYDPLHLLLRHELDELFDTTPDLSGADIDISRFIRSGEERDLQVFWVEVARGEDPPPAIKPMREALCAVPFLKARDWLCGKESGTTKAPRLKPAMRAWIWSWLDGAWRRAERRDLFPGQVVLVDAQCGGYDPDQGWAPAQGVPVTPIAVTPIAPGSPKMSGNKPCWRFDDKQGQAIATRPVAHTPADEIADATQDSEALSILPWQTIAFHGGETGRRAKAIADLLCPALAGLFDLAGRWHDVGKAHEAFQVSIRLDGARPVRDDLAKAPDAAWPCSPRNLYRIGRDDHRPGFRHELASTLALLALLHRRDPDHPALLGPWRSLLGDAGLAPPPARVPRDPASTLEQEVLALDADGFDLLAYLICAHHGKVRLAWHASPADQQAADGRLRIRGLIEGDGLPAIELATSDGGRAALPALTLTLAPAAAGLNPITGRGWTERVLGLLERHGPFALAWLEALLRAADQRASAANLIDPCLIDPSREDETQ